MDEHKLDQFFREELENYPPAPYREGAWEAMAVQVPTGISPWRRIWPWMILTFLGISISINLYQWIHHLGTEHSHANLEPLNPIASDITLPADTSTILPTKTPTIQTDTVRDTVFVYVPAKPSSKLAATPGSGQHLVAQSPVKNEPTAVNDDQPITGSSGADTETKEIETDLVEVESGLNPEFPKQDSTGSNDILIAENQSSIEENQKDSTQVVHTELSVSRQDSTAITSTSDSLSNSESEKPDPKKSSVKLQLKRWLSGISYNYGARLGAGLYVNPVIIGADLSGTGLVEARIARNLDIQTGLSYRYLYYKIEDRISELSQAQLQQYPELLSPQAEGPIKEIYMQAHVLEIPIGLRYTVYETYKLACSFQSHLFAHYYLRQQFKYEYETASEEERYVNAAPAAFQLAYLRLGTGLNLKRWPMDPRIGLYVQTDLSPTGAEAMRFWSTGIQLSFWWDR